MKIRINGIFNKYNNEIDLKSDSIIMIGENGIGKSTTLRILYCIFKMDFISICHYKFESIEFVTDKEKVEVKYEDFILPFEYMKAKVLGENYDKFFEEVREYCEGECKDYDFEMTIYEITSNYKEHIKEYHIDENEIPKKLEYARWISCFNECYNDFFRDIVRNISNKKKSKLTYSKIIKNKIREAKQYIEIYDDFQEDFIKVMKDGLAESSNRVFKNSKVYKQREKISELITSIQFKSCFMLNQANDYEIENMLENECVMNREESALIPKEKTYGIFERKFHHAHTFYKEWLESNSIDNIIKGYKKKYAKYKIEDEIRNLKTFAPSSKNKISIGKILFSNVYNKNFFEEFIKDYITFLKGNMSQEIEKKYSSIKDETMKKMIYYLRPLLVENSLFTYGIMKDETEGLYFNRSDNTQQLLCNFYKKYENKYINIENDKLKKLNILLDKYFKNKKLTATPFGIAISENNEFGNELEFSELSMGEQKLLIIFVVSIFLDNAILLLDEPETSLSLIWQEELIPDLLEYTNLKKIIVSTQSPYIVRDERLLSDIVYLPLEEIKQ